MIIAEVGDGARPHRFLRNDFFEGTYVMILVDTCHEKNLGLEILFTHLATPLARPKK